VRLETLADGHRQHDGVQRDCYPHILVRMLSRVVAPLDRAGGPDRPAIAGRSPGSLADLDRTRAGEGAS
jgi:hypothetical protein